MAPTSCTSNHFIPPRWLFSHSGTITTSIFNTKIASRPDPSNNCRNFLATKLSSITPITNYNISVSFFPTSTFVDVWPPGNHQNCFDHYRMIPTRPYPTSSNRPIQHTSARSTNGASTPSYGVVRLKAKKQMEKRPRHHLLLQILLWPTPTCHLQCPQHYDPPTSTSITRTTFHSTTLAPFPRLSSRHTRFRGSSRS